MVIPSLPVNRILTGNCIQLLETIPEKSIDLIFADPPYNLQLSKELRRPDTSRVIGVQESWDQFSDFESYDSFTRKWMLGCRRILKDTGTMWVIGSYHNIYRVGKIMQDLGFWILNDIVWIKNNPMPNFRGVRFTNAHEILIWAQKIKGKRYTFNYQVMKSMNAGKDGGEGLQMRSDWMLPLCKGKERLKIGSHKVHPTQKPEALLTRVILSSSNPGDVILDPFFGTGTTGVVAKRLGRSWIGIEAEAEYISPAQQRIDAAEAKSDLLSSITENSGSRKKRIPFRKLLEAGLLKEGQILYFKNHGGVQATILPDGRINCYLLTGSIHKVGSTLLSAPCNGWMAWYYINQVTGEREPIDVLRQKFRQEIASRID